MKRFTVFGLCLVASFALSALVAVGAQAKKAEHGPLVVVSSGGLSEFGGGGKGALHSPSNSGGGEFENGTKGTAFSSFIGVELESTGLKCTTSGQAAGTVKTDVLNETMGWLKAPTEAGVEFSPHSGTELARFNCGGVAEFAVTGSVLGQVSPLNESSLTSQLNLRPNAAKTHNEPTKFEGSAEEHILKSSVNGGTPTESYQQQENVTVTNHGNSTVCKKKLKKGVETEKCKPAPAEINTIATGSPEIGRCDKQKGGKFTDTNCKELVAPGGKGKYEFVEAGL
jgi:hypothetical protein